jgi:hypothetical protein
MNELEHEFFQYVRQGQMNEVLRCLEHEPSLVNLKEEVSQQSNNNSKMQYRFMNMKSELYSALCGST